MLQVWTFLVVIIEKDKKTSLSVIKETDSTENCTFLDDGSGK